MKNNTFKQILTFIMMIVSVVAMAQYYPESGDTIYGSLPEKYYAPWWVYDDWTLTSTMDSAHVCNCTDNIMRAGWGRDNPFFGMRLETDRPLRVLGLAGVAGAYDDGLNPLDVTVMDTSDFFELREINPEKEDSIYMLRRAEWFPNNPARTLMVPLKRRNGSSAPCGDYIDTVLSFRIMEAYFDEPVIVDDSFYVGGTNNNYVYNAITVRSPNNGYESVVDWPRSMSADYGIIDIYSGANCPKKEFLYWSDEDYWRGGYFFHLRNHCIREFFLLIFPIIDPYYNPEPPVDTFSCPEPTGLELLDKDTASVWLQWQTHPSQNSWNLGYCEAGMDFDSLATTMSCSTHELVRVTNLRPDTEYEFRVQAYCSHNDSLYLSPWSEPLLVATDTVPSSDTVNVTRPDTTSEVLSVEYFDLLGRQLAQPPARGLYIRRTTTTQGVSTRKFVRQ